MKATLARKIYNNVKEMEKHFDKELKEYEAMKNIAELKALSKISLERPLTDQEHKKIMELKREVLK
jgi:hypothetical protein